MSYFRPKAYNTCQRMFFFANEQNCRPYACIPVCWGSNFQALYLSLWWKCLQGTPYFFLWSPTPVDKSGPNLHVGPVFDQFCISSLLGKVSENVFFYYWQNHCIPVCWSSNFQALYLRLGWKCLKGTRCVFLWSPTPVLESCLNLYVGSVFDQFLIFSQQRKMSYIPPRASNMCQFPIACCLIWSLINF